ncbi:hypothetical protein HDU87_006453 [Geranomyces variabilis]|uniref:Uncharacterized protein n=1 Tax=Geranomyces variabilis TaxID=109894 RepID=A0AAD5TF84_9FUNG|nr:hypothetical protein HDU87_006453 [Geranomyces variabilis]
MAAVPAQDGKQQQQQAEKFNGKSTPAVDYDEKVLRDKGRKLVLKNVFESALTYNWPAILPTDNEAILALLCSLLLPIGDHRRELLRRRSQATHDKVQARKKARGIAAAAALEQQQQAAEEASKQGEETKTLTLAEVEAAQKAARKKKKRKATEALDANPMPASVPAATAVGDGVGTSALPPPPAPPPGIMQSLTLGLNSIAAELANQHKRQTAPAAVRQAEALSPRQFKDLRLVFLCSGDVSSPNLFAHIPSLTYLAGPDVILCPFAKGALPRLASALGMKSCAAIGVKSNTPLFDQLYTLVASKVPPPCIPWLPRVSVKVKSNPPGNASSLADSSAASASLPAPSNPISADAASDAPSAASAAGSASLPAAAQPITGGFEYQPTKVKVYKTTAPLRNDKKRGGGGGPGRGGAGRGGRGGKNKAS